MSEIATPSRSRRRRSSGCRWPPTPSRPTRPNHGTYAWDATTIVVVHAQAGGERGIGYTYADRSTARLVDEHLGDVVRGADALAPSARGGDDPRGTQLGRPGACAMAISAVDVALWDLKARLLGLPLATLLGGDPRADPVDGSGGFTSYSIDAPAPAGGLGPGAVSGA